MNWRMFINDTDVKLEPFKKAETLILRRSPIQQIELVYQLNGSR